MEEAVAQKRKACIKYLFSPTPVDEEEYKETRSKVKIIVRQTRRQSLESLVSNIKHDVYGRQGMAFKILKTNE